MARCVCCVASARLMLHARVWAERRRSLCANAGGANRVVLTRYHEQQGGLAELGGLSRLRRHPLRTERVG